MLSHRLIARIRSEAPALFLLPPLIAGQAVATMYPHGSVAAAICGFAYLCIRTATCRRILPRETAAVTGVVAGILLTLFHSPPPAFIKEHATYFAVVDGSARTRRTNEIQLPLRVTALRYRPEGAHAVVHMKQPWLAWCRATHLPWRNIAAVQQGDLIAFTATIRPLAPGGSPFSYQQFLRRHGYAATCRIHHSARIAQGTAPVWSRARQHITRTVRSINGDNERSGLFLSMAFGIRDTLTRATENAFQRAGLTHLLVVSGYQVTLVFYSIMALLRWGCALIPALYTVISVRIASLSIALLASCAFVALTGIDGASLRAALALLIVVTVRAFERGGSAVNPLAVSLLLLLLIWPGCLFEPGVQLTYAALCGILRGAQVSGSALKKYCAVCLYASLFTTPVVLAWFEHISFIGFLLNPLLGAVFSMLSCQLGFLLTAGALLSLPGAETALLVLIGTLTLLRDFVCWCAELPWAAAAAEGHTKHILMCIAGSMVAFTLRQRIKDYAHQFNLRSHAAPRH